MFRGPQCSFAPQSGAQRSMPMPVNMPGEASPATQFLLEQAVRMIVGDHIP
jgi:hypothetical protein